ncbi:hypothetical protein IAR55_000106 [Kwoniella newhampshirensis]|uniref:3'-5' exonuclease domain-containing protein n=1 Tax=Kwoniella newhampshirensis TaxID=1651941 RepID=A0AAW0Z5S6_9TREE
MNHTTERSGAAKTSRSKVETELEGLDLGIGIWEGKTVFTSEPATIRTPRTERTCTTCASHKSQTASGTASSPISVASTSSSPSASPLPLPQPRATPHYTSPLPRTAFTPPRTVPTPSGSSVTRHNASSSQGASGSSHAGGSGSQKPIHPFFVRARSAPVPHRPRLVAHYSSSESGQTSSESDGTVTTTEDSHSQSQDLGQDPGVRREKSSEIDQLAEAVERLEMSRRPLTVPPILPIKPSPIVSQAQGKGKGKEKAKERQQLPLFHYSTYTPKPSVAYTTSASEADDLVSCLRGNVLGLDLEWPPAGTYKVPIPGGGGTMDKKIGMKWNEKLKKYEWGQGRTALVQLCDDKLVVLIHLGENMDLPKKVIEIIRDPSIYKLGVQVKGDGLKLLRDFPGHFGPSSSSNTPHGSEPQENRGPSSLLELSYLARAVDPIGTGPGNTLIKLSTLCSAYLGKELDKSDDVRRGNWFSVLGQRERDYAANDVYSSIQIFHKLRSLGEERGVSLNLDTFCSNVGAQSTTSLQSRSLTVTNGLASGGVMNKFIVPADIKPPSPAQLSALTSFIEGKGIVEIASTRSIKLSTAESYICNSVQILGINVLEEEHKKRLWDEIPADSWTWKRFKSLYSSLKDEFGGIENSLIVSFSQDEDRRSTSSDSEEEIEQVESR